MPDRIYEPLHRNLQEVFGEGDAARRRAAIAELYTEDCVLDAPTGVNSPSGLHLSSSQTMPTMPAIPCSARKRGRPCARPVQVCSQASAIS